MTRFHGLVLIVNTLLPAIVGLVLIAVYLALLRPALEDAAQVRASFGAVERAAAALGEQYARAGTSFGQRVETVRTLIAPVGRLYGGVQKLSRNFCGNVGKPDLWSARPARVHLASLDRGAMLAFGHQSLIGGARDFIDDSLGRLKGGGARAADFARTGACEATGAAFEKTFTVLGAVMAPFGEIDLVIRDLAALYAALHIEATFPALVRIGERLATAWAVLGYLALALLAWFFVQYLSWAAARLRQGWVLVTR